MNRRSLLAASGTSVLLGVSGCLDELDSGDENETDDDGSEGEVPGCLQKESWPDGGGEIEDPPSESIAGRRDCTNADRPEPTGDVCTEHEITFGDGTETFRSEGVEPYPDPPEEFTEEAVRSFVSDYEQAYRQNGAVERLEDRLLGFSVSVEDDATQTLEADDDIDRIRIEYTVGSSIVDRDGAGTVESDPYGDAAVYGVDETGVVRAEAEYYQTDDDDEEETPDPVEEGDLLECF
ncbi:hypothetical protein OB905_09540 [Halobacteria archaeon AArc-dxtr1]|nr:hypothetical protein [Halobacteria archaeon AArc-dxtr1]